MYSFCARSFNIGPPPMLIVPCSGCFVRPAICSFFRGLQPPDAFSTSRRIEPWPFAPRPPGGEWLISQIDCHQQKATSEGDPQKKPFLTRGMVNSAWRNFPLLPFALAYFEVPLFVFLVTAGLRPTLLRSPTLCVLGPPRLPGLVFS